MCNIDKIADRIQKLLKLAESDNEHESALAASRAADLLAKHNLTLAEIAARNPEAAPEAIEMEYLIQSRRISNWKVRLAGGVARACDCRILIAAGRGINILGTVGDIAAARVLFAYLCEASDRCVKREKDLSIDYLRASQYGDGNKYVRSFRLGLAERLSVRVQADAAARKETVEADASAGTALVLSSKRDRVALATRRRSSGRGYGTSGASDGSGYRRGYTEGGNVGLNRQLR
jgi:hypothetical protein